MTRFESAVKVVVEDIKRDAKIHGVRWECVNTWAELLDWFGSDSAQMKEDIIYTLSWAGIYTADDGSIEDTDGTIKTYRQLTNAVRKAIFA